MLLLYNIWFWNSRFVSILVLIEYLSIIGTLIYNSLTEGHNEWKSEKNDKKCFYYRKMFLTKTNYRFEKVAIIRGVITLTSVKLCLYKAGSGFNENEGAILRARRGHYYNVSPVHVAERYTKRCVSIIANYVPCGWYRYLVS